MQGRSKESEGSWHVDIKLIFKSNNGTLKAGRKELFRILSLEGIESGENELFVTSNAFGDGSIVNNRKITSKPISAEIKYQGKNKARTRKEVITFFNIHNGGNLIMNINGVERYIAYEVESFKIKQDHMGAPLSFMVSLLCPDPYFKELKEKKAEIAIWRPTFKFPLAIKEEGIEMGYREPSLIVNIFNGGDAEAGMKFVFKADATVESPSLFNVNTREYFKVEKTLIQGDRVEVSTGYQDKKVTFIRNGIRSTLHEWDYNSTFMQLDRGDNLFRYDADEGLDNLSVDIYYTQKYLGV